jgi:hypothetical protein
MITNSVDFWSCMNRYTTTVVNHILLKRNLLKIEQLYLPLYIFNTFSVHTFGSYFHFPGEISNDKISFCKFMYPRIPCFYNISHHLPFLLLQLVNFNSVNLHYFHAVIYIVYYIVNRERKYDVCYKEFSDRNV